MCIGTPMQIQDVDGLRAACAGRGERQFVDLSLVGTQSVGTWVLAFQGTAMRVLDPADAERTNAALDAMHAALNGAVDLDRYFADLVDREPELPPHLRGTTP
ncbi:MAG TPA: HypC/HybG/HupF family hydrogenase formation chaperone [Casimicrobiaceae bacterium]|nr:HypC/HybG/HupF family hydrogenase formation chaperone [Casimicrobiaceae bacterium]